MFSLVTKTGLTGGSTGFSGFSASRRENTRVFAFERLKIEIMGDEEHKIYVGSLSFKTDDNSLREYFETQVDVVEGKDLRKELSMTIFMPKTKNLYAR